MSVLEQMRTLVPTKPYTHTTVTLTLTLKKGHKAHPLHQQRMVFQELFGDALVRQDVDEVTN